ncbi:hypothetical protein IJG98_01480 [Candidatus Saccharibacteria bacterium]|nr:hypothetical protein [Candidatus Saccharibacteria bacterium]
MKNNKRGSVVANEAELQGHELDTAYLLAKELGVIIEPIPKSNIKGVHTPDIMMLGEKWEMKSPTGDGKWLINKRFHEALHQSPNVIFDLRRMKMSEERAIRELKKEFKLAKAAKRLLIVTKKQKIIDINKK